MPFKIIGPDGQGRDQREMMLFDSWNPEKDVVATKVLDISALGLPTAQAVLKFATVRRGPIVQLQDRYERGIDMGSSAHFFPQEEGVDGLVGDPVFRDFAEDWAMTPQKLAAVVIEHLSGDPTNS